LLDSLKGRRVVVAGASGFVGRWLCAALVAEGAEVVGLGRSVEDGAHQDGVTWRRCDLFSLLDCERGLQGAEIVYYLVHSMMPSTRLTQATFEDMDLILADNMARAAAFVGAKRIIYLGGLIPADQGHLSRHLSSRLEVEAALGAHGVPVTPVRAGLVLGPKGSSFDMLRLLVERLPGMVLPPWTRTPTQPIWIGDVVQVMVRVVAQNVALGESLDVGAPQVLRYRELIEEMAVALNAQPRIMDIPFGPKALSKLWVSLVTGTSRDLVAPLIDSLDHPMVARNRDVQLALGVPGVTVSQAMARALADNEPPLPTVPRGARPEQANTVRSVQRLPLPENQDADWAAQEYTAWMPRGLWPFLKVVQEDDGISSFRMAGLGIELLRLRYSKSRSSPSRALLYVVGGLLVVKQPTKRGRLELRSALDERTLLAAIHDFEPSLPWYLYLSTQALVHLAVMKVFGWHLKDVANGQVPSAQRPRTED
jgi:uncharacterized protein YbjT (DUF2867 family)